MLCDLLCHESSTFRLRTYTCPSRDDLPLPLFPSSDGHWRTGPFSRWTSREIDRSAISIRMRCAVLDREDSNVSSWQKGTLAVTSPCRMKRMLRGDRSRDKVCRLHEVDAKALARASLAAIKITAIGLTRSRMKNFSRSPFLCGRATDSLGRPRLHAAPFQGPRRSPLPIARPHGAAATLETCTTSPQRRRRSRAS